MMNFPRTRKIARIGAPVAVLALVSACSKPLDYDLRGHIGAFSTAPAASQATADRPKPDDRGVISYPNYQVAVARRGDTVGTVATRVGLPAAELARYNGIDPNATLREGEVIALPRRVPASGGVDIAALAGSAIDSAPEPGAVQTTALPSASGQTSKPAAQTGQEPVRHKVARGETAYTISRLYQVPVKSLAEWNGLGSDFAVREGQYLLIPVQGAKPPRAAAAAAATTAPGAGSPTPTPPSATGPLPAEQVKPAAESKPQTVTADKPTKPAQTGQLAMPVSGKIVREYSPGRNNGIDISASSGAQVSAAADGNVLAITEDTEGTSIVIVRHSNKLVTVYANVDDIAVKKGDTVKRGQKLAQTRSGGNTAMHFEVREGLDSVDPMLYLK